MLQNSINKSLGGCLVCEVAGADAVHDHKARARFNVRAIHGDAPVVHEKQVFPLFTKSLAPMNAPSITDWVDNNLDPSEQKIVGQCGPHVSDTVWDLWETNDGLGARCVYIDHAKSIWALLYERSEAFGQRPLELLDRYAHDFRGVTICSSEALEVMCVVWAIDTICYRRLSPTNQISRSFNYGQDHSQAA